MWRARWLVLCASLPVFAGALPVLDPKTVEAAPLEPEQKARGKRARASSGTVDSILSGFDPRVRELADGRLTTPLSGSRRAVLTVDPELDTFVRKLLERSEVPHAGLVAVEPRSGKLLAYVSHTRGGRGPDRVLEASAPAASIFKVVTATALLKEGVNPSRSVCYHGGSRRLVSSELVDDPKRDTACASLAGALGFSINAVFGKLAVRHLNVSKLERQARAYGFGERLPFDVPTEASALDVPKERLEFARTAAGFWHTHMSPLHAAVMAASIANGGRMMRPGIVEKVVDKGGEVLFEREPILHRRVTDARSAAKLAKMLRSTVDQGTARRSFHDARGRPLLPGISVAGKTGTLSSERPYRGYTWWVGFAPSDRPKIALAVLVVNEPSWRIKASQVAAEALRHYLVDAPRDGRSVARR